MTPEEKLRRLLQNYVSPETGGAALGDHLRDEDFIRLIEHQPMETIDLPEGNGSSAAAIADEFVPLRLHLAGCDSCLDQFKDFYLFFAPAAKGEPLAGKKEIAAAWQSFAPRIAGQNQAPEVAAQPVPFWSRLFPAERNSNYFAAFGWAFAALLLLLSGFSIFVAWQARNEKTQLAGVIEEQKQTYEERLKTLAAAAQNRDLDAQEKTRLAEEKDELQKRIDLLQTDLERAKQGTADRAKTTAPPVPNQPAPDNSLVAVNTPIYDVFPADSAVRSGGGQSPKKFVVPRAARNVVLILNAAGRADSPAYRAELISRDGKSIWRGGGLTKDSLGNFTITLSRAALKAGNYRLRLFAQGSASPIAEYPIAIDIK